MQDAVDVAILGGGLAGSALAAVAAARGLRVALCDLHEVYPTDFRAEKLSPLQADLLARLGLWDDLRGIVTPIDDLGIARLGRIVERRPNREYGIDYADLVNTIRARVPRAGCAFGRVAGVKASGLGQTVMFGDGRTIKARLAVIATGLGKNLLSGLDIRRAAVQPGHCLAIGFDVAAAAGIGPRTSLTYHGERVVDRSAYLTLFPIGDRLRANLFVYRRRDEDWSRAFGRRPREMLLQMMPGLASLIGDFTVIGQPVLRPIDLHASEGHLRDGVVLVGDAFSTTCPAGGSGIDKVLTDVDRLAALIPGWLDTPGMGRDKIEQFYTDPAKVACDEHAWRMIGYAKAMAVDPGLAWTVRRYRNFYGQKVRYWLRRRLSGPGTSRAA